MLHSFAFDFVTVFLASFTFLESFMVVQECLLKFVLIQEPPFKISASHLQSVFFAGSVNSKTVMLSVVGNDDKQASTWELTVLYAFSASYFVVSVQVELNGIDCLSILYLLQKLKKIKSSIHVKTMQISNNCWKPFDFPFFHSCVGFL